MTEIVLIIKPSVELQMALDDLAHGLRELASAIRTQKASPPEPTGGPVAAQNGGAIEPETLTPAATITQPSIAAGEKTWDPKWATPERRALLMEMYRSNARLQEIKRALDALPGFDVPAPASLQTFAIQVLRVGRPSAATGFRIGAGTPMETRHVP